MPAHNECFRSAFLFPHAAARTSANTCYFYRMKKCSTLFAAVLLAGPMFAQTTVFSEDFEAGIPSAWTITVADTLTPADQVAEFAPGWIGLEEPFDAANHVAGATSYFDPIGRANRWLITPPISLGGYGNVLSWRGISHDPSWPEDYLVLISTTGTATADFTDTLTVISPEDEYWTTHEVNLSDSGYNAGSVHIAFVLRTYNGFKLYLDDVEMRIEDPLGVEEIASASVELYPNPAGDHFFIGMKSGGKSAAEVEVYSAAGSRMNISANAAGRYDISAFPAGVYFVRIRTENGTAVKRLVKQ
jgi:hypothetical protein